MFQLNYYKNKKQLSNIFLELVALKFSWNSNECVYGSTQDLQFN